MHVKNWWPGPRSGPRWVLNVLLAATLAGLLAGLALAAGPPESGPRAIGGGGDHPQAALPSTLPSTLASTIGQPVAGRTAAGGLALCSGFRCAALALAQYEVYLPVVVGRLNH